MFSEIMTDVITIEKRDGKAYEEIRASVEDNIIFIYRSDIFVESGDLIIRKMSNGAEEKYEVIDPGFHEKFHSIPAGYKMKVHKIGIPSSHAVIQNITYNVTGQNARVNQSSIDQSLTIMEAQPEFIASIEALRWEIKEMVKEENQRREAMELVDHIEEQFQSGTPRKSVVKALMNSLPVVGNISSICSLLLALLS